MSRHTAQVMSVFAIAYTLQESCLGLLVIILIICSYVGVSATVYEI